MSSEEITFNIKEVAKLLGVTPATIRNWEKQGLYKARRGSNNYRIYNFDDIKQLEKIRYYLQEQKINSSGIRSLLHTSYATRESNEEVDSRYSKRFMSRRWKEAREEAGLTLEEVSSGTKISLSYLSKIENGVANPSMEILESLADFYHKNILHFFMSATETKHILPEMREEVPIQTKGVAIESLVGLKNHIMQPMYYRVKPGCGILNPHTHEGEEFLFVVRGTIEMVLNSNETHRIEPNSSIYFRSREAHSWKNVSADTAEIIWVHVPYES